MNANLYWIEGVHPGRLGIMPRPRGNDWLEDEVLAWRRAGVDVAVSLLTPDEVAQLELLHEGELCHASEIQFLSFPIVDREVPESKESFPELISMLSDFLSDGKSIAVHCRQGIGRASLVAIALLVWRGIDPEVAIQRVIATRGCTVPETPEQRRWILDFARSTMKPLSR